LRGSGPRYRLDAGRRNPHHKGVSRPDGRSGYGRKAAGEESPGSIDIRCRITSGGGDPRESATENEPPRFGEARVKRCGKSAPRFRQRRRHGKPHREQNRIGMASRAVRESDNAAELCQARRPGRLLEAMCKHGPRGMAVTYRPRKRAVPYRTRLTGRLIRLMRGSARTRRAPRHFLHCHSGASRSDEPRNPYSRWWLWIPGSRQVARPGMTERRDHAAIFSNNAINVSGAVTFGEWLASISK
jgi:hypothetical protein